MAQHNKPIVRLASPIALLVRLPDDVAEYWVEVGHDWCECTCTGTHNHDCPHKTWVRTNLTQVLRIVARQLGDNENGKR